MGGLKRSLLFGVLFLFFGAAVHSADVSEIPTKDAYWKRYATEGQAMTSKVIATNPDRHGFRLGFGIRDFSDPLGLGIPFVQVAYVRQQSDVEYHVDVQLGLANTKMRDSKVLFLTNGWNTRHLFYDATLLSFGGGIDWRLKDVNAGLNLSLFGLNDSNTSVFLSGLSFGGTLSRPFSIAESITLTPYVGVDYNLITKTTIAGATYSVSGLNGMGVSFGVHVTPLW